MHRRTLVLSSVAALLAPRPAPTAPLTRGLLIRGGQDRHSRRVMLAGRNPTDRKLSTADSDGALFMLEHHLMGKGGPARHVHHAQDEWFYAVAGSFVIEVGEERFQLDAGDFVFAPRRVPHVWACVSDAPGTILIGVHPALTFERFIERLGELTSPAPAELGALFAEHGMAVVGPPLEVP